MIKIENLLLQIKRMIQYFIFMESPRSGKPKNDIFRISKKRISMKKIAYLLLVSVLLSSCTVTKPRQETLKNDQESLLVSVLWFQKSAEMRALFLQGYNTASRILEEKNRTSGASRPRAVIMDLDETVLDNSPSEVNLIRNNIPFTDSLWKRWVSTASAKACPGAPEFIRLAESLGVEVFYVSNREMAGELEPTIRNLEKLGIPFADSEHMILKTGSGSKEARRKALREKFDILMLVGDNLADFDSVFDNREGDLGFGAVEQMKDRFGTDFIILPNPMYGPWINAATKNHEGSTPTERMINALEEF
jgi:5'-nucleotidase (lipoprotein e(P4) family)